MKRIEASCKRLEKLRIRLSRTGGLNAGGTFRGVTLNSKHSLRVSKTFKGLTTGLQGGKLILRGRWSTSNGRSTQIYLSRGYLFQQKVVSAPTIGQTQSFLVQVCGHSNSGKKAAGPACFCTICDPGRRCTSSCYLLKLALWLTEFIVEHHGNL